MAEVTQKRVGELVFLSLIALPLSGCSFIKKFTAAKDYACEQHFEKVFKESPDQMRDPNLYNHESFYSKSLNTCVTSWDRKTGLDFAIQDITKDYLKWPQAALIFHCDQAGADSIIRSAVEKYKGEVYEVTYRLWMDNAEGGEPRAIKTPDQLYNRDKCEGLFKKWISELK